MHCLQPCVIADVFEYAFGKEHTAGFADGFDTGGYIETVAEGICAVIADVADVDADADRDFGVFLVFDLHFDGAFHGVDAAVEDAEGSVAEELEDFAFILFVEGDEDIAVAGAELEGAFLVDVHQVGIAHDVGEDDGGEAAFEFTFHWL